MERISKGEQTRQRIIEEAATIFNQRGYEATSMQDVMDATGLEKGGLYRHFASKEELAAEALRYALDRSVRRRTQDLGDIAGAIARLKFCVKRFVETPSTVPGGCPLMNAATYANEGRPVLRELARKSLTEWRERLCELLLEGVRSGEIQQGTDARRIANVMIATLEGAIMMSRLERSKEPLRDAQLALDAVLDGLVV